jgi:hypothetical protein
MVSAVTDWRQIQVAGDKAIKNNGFCGNELESDSSGREQSTYTMVPAVTNWKQIQVAWNKALKDNRFNTTNWKASR